MNTELLNRRAVCSRWKISLRTLDRLRQDGRLPWVDIGAGRTSRPIVRFKFADVEAFEAAMRREISGEHDEMGVQGDAE